MKRRLTRLLMVALLLCSSLGSATGVWALGLLTNDQRHSRQQIQKDRQQQQHSRQQNKQSEQQIRQDDGYLKPVAEEPQSPVEVAFRSVTPSHRVASSRPTRLIPTHGGKPTHHGGRWAKGETLNPIAPTTLPPSAAATSRLHATAASPRLRYVIALRRLLC